MSDRIRFKDGGVTFSPGTVIGDLTVEEFTKWWDLVVTQPMLATLPAQADATATKASEPQSSGLEAVLADTFGWEEQPTTKAAEPAGPLDHFIHGLSAPVTKEHKTGGIGNMFANVYGWENGRPVE